MRRIALEGGGNDREAPDGLCAWRESRGVRKDSRVEATSLPAATGFVAKIAPQDDTRIRSAKFWLRGLDSNQDNQLQRLACYQLHYPGNEASEL